MILEAKNITKSFTNQNRKMNVFRNISLNIEKGELITIMGPSGSGKSTLLNAITTRSKLAPTSKTPGRTQELNFFSVIIDRPVMNIVDMPGYGFARASKKKIKEWTDLSKFYLQNSGRYQILKKNT